MGSGSILSFLNKFMKKIYVNNLIIGAGAAGFAAGLELAPDCLIIHAGSSVSGVSLWNLKIKSKEILKKEMLETGCYNNNRNVLDAFLNNFEQAVLDLEKLGIKFRYSNIGKIPDYKINGPEVLKIMKQRFLEKKGKILKANVVNLLSKNKKIIGIRINQNGIEKDIVFNNLILASGGLQGFFKHHLGGNHNGSILAMLWKAGLKTKDLEYLMFHPFLINDERLPKFIISGDLVTKIKFVNSKGQEFLPQKISKALKNNEHHCLFPEMNKVFYKESLKGDVCAVLNCDKAWFEKFKKQNEFGWIFNGVNFNQIKKIKVTPVFHYSIGGLVINQKAQTSQPNIYAVGEISTGLFGANRSGGLAIPEALVFGKIAAQNIKKEKFKQKNKVVKYLVMPNAEISKELKELVWESLGPVKNIKTLKKNYKKLFLENRGIAQEFILAILKTSINKKKNLGSFYRDDLDK